ncbi:MAG: CopD family protein [Myxococcota bacterium]
MTYFLAKALHIIGFVTWFAGLFYVVRLFIYWVESAEQPEPARSILQKQLSIMSRRLWYGITWPAMIGTLAFGSWLLAQYQNFSLGWIHAKLSLVLVLVAYHLTCGRIYRSLAAGHCTWSSTGLRIWNEVATLLLVSLVFVAVFKTMLDTVWAIGALILLAGILALAIRVYRLRRGAT